MPQGEFRVAEQAGAKGYFGKVVLEVEPSDKDDINFDPEHASQWTSGASFGIAYVLEHIAKRKLFPKGVRIHVSRIEGHEVDTTNVVIAYAAAHALVNALGIEPKKQPNFDKETGLFVFPK